MKSTYLAFVTQHWGNLAFGFLLMALSSFGQTFFISLFGAELRVAYGLSDGGLGTAYAVGTISSALCITWLGRWIDRTSVARYAMGTAGLLAVACIAMAAGRDLPVLVGSLFLLRLAGQGLMVHTSQTTTARRFHAYRGRALGFTGLGMAAGEALLPLIVVHLITGVGWRAVWVVGAGTVLLGTALALLCLPREADSARKPRHAVTTTPGVSDVSLWRDPRMLAAIPAVLAPSFIATGFFFHQVRLAEEKNWALTWLAGWFVAYAITRAVAMVAIGPAIDRFGAARTLPWQLVPLGLSMVALGVSDSPWAVPFYLLPIGVSAGIGTTLLTALWTELYGPERLAAVRSYVTAASVLASGLSPTLFGWLIDLHVSLSDQAVGCLIYTIAAGLLASRVGRVAPANPPGMAVRPFRTEARVPGPCRTVHRGS